jgi:hypothetical protein
MRSPRGLVKHPGPFQSRFILRKAGRFVDGYPLAFLRTVGNIQADGIPPCFYPLLKKINRSVGKRNCFGNSSSDDEDEDEEDDRSDNADDCNRKPHLQAVKGVSAQFYNYIMHRVATCAGRHDAQQGTVTAAVSGAFTTSKAHKKTALDKQTYCDIALPSK